MATPTYELIETTTLTSSASSVTFSSITQDYRDLVLVVQTVSPSERIRLYINGDTGSNYDYVYLVGDGSSASSGGSTGTYFNDAAIAPSDPSLGIFQFLDYSATDKHKPVLGKIASDAETYNYAGRWANTSAITEIEIIGDTKVAGCVFSLYGIAS